ncbi:hypothetical protein OBBRIDRAFT_214357 [Obba rivulosa]|uniref:Secreted protein n=1 Tax=Obba rivulosa TaxID=1052685 RepID=A0A8E2DQJ1_9APHY|nr:hypothetical protein OBBRIDRAFT_214357 [Obba rivulosa]
MRTTNVILGVAACALRVVSAPTGVWREEPSVGQFVETSYNRWPLALPVLVEFKTSSAEDGSTTPRRRWMVPDSVCFNSCAVNAGYVSQSGLKSLA